MKFAVTALVAACATTTVVPVDDQVVVSAPRVPHARFTVVGAQLGDTAAVQRIRHRVRLNRFGRAWTKLDETSTERDSHVEIDWLPVLPVIAETFDRIRIVAGDDHARFAMWIDRADAAPTLRVPIELADEHGHADPTRGVWLEAGAPIAVKGAGERRFVELHDTRVVAGGWIPAEVIGHVWIASDDDHHPTAMEESVTRDEGEAGPTLVADQVIASAPRPEAAVIAKTIEGVHAKLIKTEGDWSEIEIERPYVRVRGFVPSHALHDELVPIGHGAGSGSGWGMSKTLEIEVPAGSCLYDGADGEIIGVATVGETRRAERLSNSWWRIMLGTRWGLIFMIVHDVANSSDPTHVSVESCAH